MKIEVGEYVRLKYGKIDKVKNNDYYMQQYIECEKGLYLRENIINHNKDIKKIIEAKDVIEINNEKYEVIYDKSYGKLGVLIPNKEQLAIRHCSLEYIFSKQRN